MAVAGRILIMPKGEYDATETYEMLDLVSHNGISWLAKKTCVGITPSNDAKEYWFNMLGISIDDINQLAVDLQNLVVHEEVNLEQIYDYMYVDLKPGYALTSAMVSNYEGESDIIIGVCLQTDKYILFTKTAPVEATNKVVKLIWTKA